MSLYCDETLPENLSDDEVDSFRVAVQNVRDHGVQAAVNNVLGQGNRWLEVMDEVLHQLLLRQQEERRRDRQSLFDLSHF